MTTWSCVTNCQPFANAVPAALTTRSGTAEAAHDTGLVWFTSYPVTVLIITAICLVAGLVFSAFAVYSYRQYRRNPENLSWKVPFVHTVNALCLFLLPLLLRY